MVIEDYMSCNELDNLQHNGQNVSTLPIQHTQLYDTIDSTLSLRTKSRCLSVFQTKCRSRCDAHRMVS